MIHDMIAPSFNTRYRRSQVGYALWRALYHNSDEPPTSFKNLLKRTLEIDREDRVTKSGLEAAPFAFADAAPEGKGNELKYSLFGAFCVAVALEMQDLGLAPQESIYFIRHIRDKLEGQFKAALTDPFAPRQDDGDPNNDKRRWMVFERVWIHQTFVDAGGKMHSGPLLMYPDFKRGMKDLTKLLGRMGYDASYRKVYVQELSCLAVDVAKHIAEAPDINRGNR
jgi:hypothetical protein